MLDKYQIKKELERAINKMALLSDKENFKNLSERISFIEYLSKMLRPVSRLLELHKNKVCASIVDNSGIDYLAMKGAFMKCLNDFENVADRGYLRSYDQDELVDDEFYHDYTTQELFLRDERSFHENSFYKNASLEMVHKGVLDNSVHLYQRVKRELLGIIRMLDEIGEYEQRPTHCFEENYQDLYRDYEDNEWQDDLEKLTTEIRFHISGHDAVQERLIQHQAIYQKELTPLEHGFLHADDPFRYIFLHRKEMSGADLRNFFFLKHRDHQYNDCIAYFNLVKEPKYKLLFRNKAAEDLVSMLMPMVAKYAGFKYAYQFVVVLMVCDDLKLTAPSRGKRGPEFVSFMNQFLKDDFLVADSSTYNPYMNKLQDRSFGQLSIENLGQTKFTQKDYEKLKDVYWFVLSLINRVLSYPLPSARFASYLQVEHRHAPMVRDFVYATDLCSSPDNLFLCRDVLNGNLESLMAI